MHKIKTDRNKKKNEQIWSHSQRIVKEYNMLISEIIIYISYKN